MKALPALVVSDEEGNLFDLPEYAMPVRHGNSIVLPGKKDIISLPCGSDLHTLPGRYPVGIDRRSGKMLTLREYEGMRLRAASAFLAPAYTALHTAAFEGQAGADTLPLFAYAPLGIEGDDFVTTAMRVDREVRQDCENFDQDEVLRRGKKLLERFAGNRLTTHLIENCAFTYLCPAARNWVMGRWEAPIPVSQGCNSQCTGCISMQEEDSGIPSTQDRLLFTPTAEEITAFTVPHLEEAPGAVVSFGQGCEGEPLTQAMLIEDSIREIRKRTKRGTINLNSNASLPAAVERLCIAGLDSIRVSANSLQKRYYDRYFSPKGYSFDDVIESIAIAKRHNVWVSLNYFIFPGFTDSETELSALTALLRQFPVDMIQMRNLNMDPDLYISTLGEEAFEHLGGFGIRQWMKEVRKVSPAICFGYFNPCLDSAL
ncbi:MAG: radical SAM protein [Proteobacteria bacterium]|nr:radical SAM protein [Pseudomonadota bacterium]